MYISFVPLGEKEQEEEYILINTCPLFPPMIYKSWRIQQQTKAKNKQKEQQKAQELRTQQPSNEFA